MNDYIPCQPQGDEAHPDYRLRARGEFSRIGWACFAMMALAQGGSGQQQLNALTTLWQEPQGYLHIVISHEELDEAEALLAQAEAMAAQGDSQSLYPVLAELRGQFRLIAETQRISAKNIF